MDSSSYRRFESWDRRFEVVFKSSAGRNLVRRCERSAGLETGGILIGEYDAKMSSALIQKVTGPTVDSKRSFAGFWRGVSGLQELLDSLWNREKPQYYLGEWHYHPEFVPYPSARDCITMKEIAMNQAFACPEPILLIVTKSPTEGWKFILSVHPTHGQLVRLREVPER